MKQNNSVQVLPGSHATEEIDQLCINTIRTLAMDVVQIPDTHPTDANETAWAWRAAIQRADGPTMLVLTRQKLPVFDRSKLAGT